MSQHCTYNVPVELLSDYKDCRLVVRAKDPSALADSLSQKLDGEIVMLQLLDIAADLEDLSTCGYGIPIEVVLKHPQSEATKLYRVTKLQRAHPVRIVMPVIAGFSKAVKVASALHLPIKLEGNQPGPDVIEELCSVLDYFLHNKVASQPLDYFTGLLTAQIHKIPISLWDIQEEDPYSFRYVTDEGKEVVARAPFLPADDGLDFFRVAFIERMLAGGEECASCPFFSECGGYFKWPDPKFSCDGVKRVFQKLHDAAYELQDDLASYPTAAMGASR